MTVNLPPPAAVYCPEAAQDAVGTCDVVVVLVVVVVVVVVADVL